MKKVILSINAGSSSVKISVYTAEAHCRPTKHAEAQISGLTSPPAKLSYIREGVTVAKDQDLSDDKKLKDSTQDSAFRAILATLIDDSDLSQVSKKEDIAIVCHRIVHGGNFRSAQIIDDAATYHRLEELNDLAPLHNAPSLEIVKSCMTQLGGGSSGNGSGDAKGKRQGPINVACFDTLFHATLPPHVRTYPIDQDIARKNGLRKYGFHGISYSFITRSVAEFLGKSLDDVNLVALHLGSGASACAVKGGKSWDTSMGLTPLAGLPGATRSGSIDPR